MNNVVPLADRAPSRAASIVAFARIERAARQIYQSGDRVFYLQPGAHPGTVIDVEESGGGKRRYRVCLDGSGAIFWTAPVMLSKAPQPIRLGDGAPL